MVELYNFYIFDKHGTCLLYREWKRDKDSKLGDTGDPMLVFGLLFSLKQVTRKLALNMNFQNQRSTADKEDDGPSSSTMQGFGTVYSLSCSSYTLHELDTISGLRFVLNSERCGDRVVSELRKGLRHIYSELYVNLIVHNPSYSPGKPISAPAFVSQLDEYIQGLAKSING